MIRPAPCRVLSPDTEMDEEPPLISVPLGGKAKRFMFHHSLDKSSPPDEKKQKGGMWRQRCGVAGDGEANGGPGRYGAKCLVLIGSLPLNDV